MNNESRAASTTHLKHALYKTLMRRIPPRKNSVHLEDIISVLVDATTLGELEVNLRAKNPPEDLKANGWPESHLEALLDSGWSEGEYSPIVWCENHLSWRRWYDSVEEAIKDLNQRANNNSKFIGQPIRHLDIHPNSLLNNDQIAAVNAILTHQLIILSGGPGTGKTSTIRGMLELATDIEPNLRVALAAPTGKATRRLHETITAGHNFSEGATRSFLATINCKTLHSWLQARPGGFGKNKHNPLDLDLLIVDEMSMVDLSLMHALLEALPKTTQLVLVGDPNQLPPIGSGAFWNKLQGIKGNKSLNKVKFHLKKIYRNRGDLAIASAVLCDYGVNSFWEKLSHIPKSGNIHRHHHNIHRIPSTLKAHIEAHCRNLENLAKELQEELPQDFNGLGMLKMQETSTANELLSSVEEIMVLCPKRRGLWGVDNFNRTFLGSNDQDGINSWPQGTPIICEQNQSDLGLANGDIGIIIGEGDKRRLLFRVLSEAQNISTRLIHPARLKSFQPALAITIHKSQGSEAKHIFLLWPNSDSTSLKSNELLEHNESYEQKLLYTAITRAKETVDVFTQKTLS